MGMYFKGRVISEDQIFKRLTGKIDNTHIGNRIWVFQSCENGKTIILGDEGNGWCVKLTEGVSKEEAMTKLKAKREKNEVFTEFVQKILKEHPNAV
jgi:hypothetical protein